MLSRGRDIAEVRLSPSSSPTYAPAIEVLNRRGEVSAALGCLPGLKPYAAYLPDPFFRAGLQAIKDLAGIAVARVNERVASAQEDRNDLLARLLEATDGNGEKLSREELTGEALGQLIAGSDTTSNTLCALLYWCLKTDRVTEKLRAEMDEAVPDDMDVPSYHTVNKLQYLHMVINETLRHHSTAALGLPRVVPPSGTRITIASQPQYFPPLTVLSVPIYTLHHSSHIWGPDAHTFNPSRWSPGTLTDRQRASFIPFSVGPRACIGRNVAEMELTVIVATVVLGFEFELREEELETREGFLRKPVGCRVGVRRRRLGRVRFL
ncbi:MAG: hypothetical protein Q9226_002325 [Calogaya cf. arnoldii]